MLQIKFHTLGCKVNQYETQVLAEKFTSEGFVVTENDNDADVLVVNSCTVTAEGDRKVRQLLRRLRRESPSATVALTGCYPQAFPDIADSLPEVDVITGSKNREGLITAVKEHMATGERVVHIVPHQKGEDFENMSTESAGKRTRAFLKIEDGCENYCAYCIIPTARGPVRSKSFEKLREELIALAQNGHKEVVLAGINLSAYGKGTEHRLIDAIELACSIDGIERVRLGSLEPDLITPEVVARMARQPKLCPQFHLSLQSGSDTVLKRMNRHYDSAQYFSVVQEIRRSFENPALTTDIMVGFPGETNEEFIESMEFAKKVGFARMHVFAYSQRSGTRAAKMDNQVPQHIKKERSHALIAVETALRQQFMQNMVGTTQTILVEERTKSGAQVGYTMNYTPVQLHETTDFHGQLVKVLITSATGDSCDGILLP